VLRGLKVILAGDTRKREVTNGIGLNATIFLGEAAKKANVLKFSAGLFIIEDNYSVTFLISTQGPQPEGRLFTEIYFRGRIRASSCD
jgi:hypothetical protein